MLESIHGRLVCIDGINFAGVRLETIEETTTAGEHIEHCPWFEGVALFFNFTNKICGKYSLNGLGRLIYRSSHWIIATIEIENIISFIDVRLQFFRQQDLTFPKHRISMYLHGGVCPKKKVQIGTLELFIIFINMLRTGKILKNGFLKNINNRHTDRIN